MRYFIFTILFTAAQALACTGVLSSDPYIELAEIISRETANPNAELRKQLKGIGLDAQGVAKMQTSALFPESLMNQIFKMLPDGTIIIDSEGFSEPGEILAADPAKNGKLISEQLHPFKLYVSWLTNEINDTLPANEKVKVGMAELRISRGDISRKGFAEWHQDGDYLAGAVSLLGPGTEYLLNSPTGLFETWDNEMKQLNQRTDVQSTPRGDTLVFSCADRWRRQHVAATAHRSPNFTGDRMFIIIRFKRAK